MHITIDVFRKSLFSTKAFDLIDPLSTLDIEAPICKGNTYTFTCENVINKPNFMNYRWQFLNNGNVINTENTIISFLQFTAENYFDEVRVRAEFDCNHTAWKSESIDFFTVPAPITDINSTLLCPGSLYNFQAIQEYYADANYEWDVFFSSGIEGGTSQSNSITGSIPVDATGTVTVNVTASNSCGSQTFSKTFHLSDGASLYGPIIQGPDGYCAGTNNEFYVVPPAGAEGLEYEWVFIGDGLSQTFKGVDITSITPDFGEESNKSLQLVCDNGTDVYGEVSEFSITVTVRNCSGSSTSAPFTDSDVNYTYQGCCGIGSGNNPHPEIGTGGGTSPIVDGVFTIELLPNPAQDHVTVKFSRGNGDTKNIKIVDAYGVERKNINTNSAAEQINISDLPLGVYTVIATKESEVATEHLQIQP